MTGNRRILRPLVALASLAAGSPAAADDGHAWRTYTNARFGFTVCWPADVVTPEPPPENDDGRSFVAPDGGRIAVWASYDALGRTVAEAARDDEQRLSGRAGTIAYRIVRKDFYVVSGRVDGQIFYNRTTLKDGTFTVVEITYPTRRKATWDRIVAMISACLMPG